MAMAPPHNWPDVLLVFSGLLVATALAMLGLMRSEALDDSPPRRAGLGLYDFFTAVALLVGGNLVAAWLAQATGLYTDADKTRTAGQYALLALSSQLFTQTPPVAWLFWRARENPRGLEELGWRPRRIRRDAILGLAGAAVALPMVMGLSTLMVRTGLRLGYPSPEYGHELLRAMTGPATWTARLGLFLSSLVLAPLLEELLFRGLVQSVLLQALGPTRRLMVIVSGATIFALVHHGVPWQALPGIWVLGLVLGWVYEKTGRLGPGIVLHAAFNAVNVGLAFLTMK